MRVKRSVNHGLPCQILMLEMTGEFFPESKYQRCIVHYYRNVFSVVTKGKVREIAMMLKAIHVQESKRAAWQKADQVIQNLREAQLKTAAQKVVESIEEIIIEGKRCLAGDNAKSVSLEISLRANVLWQGKTAGGCKWGEYVG